MKKIFKTVAFVLMGSALLLEIVLDDLKELVRASNEEPVDKSAGTTTTTTLLPNNAHESVPNDYFCVPWSVDTDEWWTHHPEWFNVDDNSTHTCFQRRSDREALLYLKIYNNQFHNDCNQVYTRIMWSSGWGADFLNVIYGLINSVEFGRPFAIAQFDPVTGWHYAAVKGSGAHAACPSKDLSCYFLPMTDCPPQKKNADKKHPNTTEYDHLYVPVYNYVTRPHQWLRRDVYNFVEKVKATLVTPCSVIHVRRADVILHGNHARKYYPVSDYVKALRPHQRKDIFILTDDQNAIDEALEFFPDIHWHYIDRPRFRGAEGGWENQVPSNSPKQEVVAILGTFQLVQMCNTIVHGQSGFSEELYRAMTMSGKPIERFRVDLQDTNNVFSAANKESDKELEKTLEEQRQQKKKGTTRETTTNTKKKKQEDKMDTATTSTKARPTGGKLQQLAKENKESSSSGGNNKEKTKEKKTTTKEGDKDKETSPLERKQQRAREVSNR